MKLIYTTMRIVKYSCLPVIVLLWLAAGCKKTASFYEKLEDLPRANKLTKTAYAVGDTLALTGKFGAGEANLAISVAGVEAPVLSLITDDSSYTQNEVLYNYTVDQVKVLITEPMIGLQQPVVATVNGVGNTLAYIVVTKDRPLPARADTLSALDTSLYKLALTMPAGTRVVPNYTPGGAIVFVNGDSVVTWQEGVIRRGKMTWEDNYGPFSIAGSLTNANYGLASDPDGNNLYISCLTKDAQLPGTVAHSAARLLKVSLLDYRVTTLNRTVFPTNTSFIDDVYLDLDTVKKEGNISEVCFPVMKNIYVSRTGGLYFSAPSFNWNAPASGASASCLVQFNLTVAHLDASGSLQYLAKGATNVNKFFQVRFRKKGVLNASYDYIPHVTTVFDYNRLMGIDAENGLLYAYTGTQPNNFYIGTFYCYNLSLKRQLSEFTPKPVNSGAPTISDGPFDVVEGNYQEIDNRYFQFPSPGQPMVIFAVQQQYQALGRPDDVWPTHEAKSVKMIDFNNRSVSTYVPYIWAFTNNLPPAPTHPGYAFYNKYRLGLGGDVIGYTAALQPVMVQTVYVDPSINDIRLLAPVQ